MAFFRAPGMEKLYSGVTKISASKDFRASSKAAPAGSLGTAMRGGISSANRGRLKEAMSTISASTPSISLAWSTTHWAMVPPTRLGRTEPTTTARRVMFLSWSR